MNVNHPDYERNKEWTLWRLTSRCTKNNDGCLIWDGSKNKNGYGVIVVTLGDEKPKTMYAHRILWMLLTNETLSRGVFIRRACGNNACLNRDHFVLRKDDSGIPQSFNKLHTRQHTFTNEQILAIRNAPGKLKDVAAAFCTTPGYVSKLRNGKAKTLVK